MSIGKELAFPRSGIRELDGMTYRQWLIGQNPGLRCRSDYTTARDWMDDVIDDVDTIIARLDAEPETPAQP